VGGRLWPSASVLGNYLLQHRSKLTGKRVLELGSGIGLGGMVAAMAGAHVTLTDGAPEVVRLLQRNTARNIAAIEACGGSISACHMLRWGEWDDVERACSKHGPFDIIIGADLLYSPSGYTPLLDTLHQLSCFPSSPGYSIWHHDDKMEQEHDPPLIFLAYPDRTAAWDWSVFKDSLQQRFHNTVAHEEMQVDSCTGLVSSVRVSKITMRHR
jgi:hypothetical protein